MVIIVLSRQRAECGSISFLAFTSLHLIRLTLLSQSGKLPNFERRKIRILCLQYLKNKYHNLLCIYNTI